MHRSDFHFQLILGGIAALSVATALVLIALDAPHATRFITVTAPATLVIGPRNSLLGDARAPYTLVEFGDYQCPPCVAAITEIEKMLHAHSGRLRFNFRNLPLPMHADASFAASAAESAGLQGKFWEMHDALFASNGLVGSGRVDKIARELGLDHARFAKDIDGMGAAIVRADEHDASKLRIRSTPCFFLCDPENRATLLRRLGDVDALMSTTR